MTRLPTILLSLLGRARRESDQSDRSPKSTDRVAAEEAAAAEEAGAIGGPSGDEDLAPSERPVVEAGGGEAEGFEQAERDLIEHAEHGEPGYPGAAAFADEREDVRTGGAYGEADEVEPTETTKNSKGRS